MNQLTPGDKRSLGRRTPPRVNAAVKKLQRAGAELKALEPATKPKRRTLREAHLTDAAWVSCGAPISMRLSVPIRLGDELEQEPSTSPAVRHPVVRKRGRRAMGRLSELQHELMQSERHLAEGQERIARHSEFVRELYAEGHNSTFAAKRLVVLAANLNEIESHRQQIVRELSAAQKRAATSLPH